MKKRNLISFLVAALVCAIIALLLSRCGSDAPVNTPDQEQISVVSTAEDAQVAEPAEEATVVSDADSQSSAADIEQQPEVKPKTKATHKVITKRSNDTQTVTPTAEETPVVVLTEEGPNDDENCPPEDIAEESPTDDAINNAPREAPEEQPQLAENESTVDDEAKYPTEGSFDGMEGRLYYDTARVINRTAFPRYKKVKIDGKRQKVKIGDTYSLILSNTYEFVETSYFENRVEEVKAQGSAHISRIRQGDVVIAQIFVCEKGWRVVGFVKNLSR